MPTDAAGGGAGSSGNIWSSTAMLLATPAARTALVGLFASAGLVAYTFRQKDRPPKVPDKDKDKDGDRHRERPRISFSSSGLNDSKNSVAIFWDVDNCSPPTGASGHTVAQCIRRAAQAAAKQITKSESNISIVSFKAYLELTTEGSQPSAARVLLHSELQGSGVSLIDTPKSGRKDVADKMMITDLLSFAIDKRPPALIVLLSGDRDFAYPLGILRNRGYEILLVVPPVGATPILEASANHVMKWRQDVLGLERDAHGKLYDRAARSIENNAGRISTPTKENHDTGKAHKVILQKGQDIHTIPPTESMKALKGPGAPPVPVIFHSLVRVLDQMRQEGYRRPLRSMCAMRLQNVDAQVYQKAGATNWADFAAVAEAAGIVTLGEGNKSGAEWVSLRSLFEEPSNGKSNDTIKNSANNTAKAEDSIDVEDMAIFYPLIEVYKSVKAVLPKGEYPTIAQMTAQLTKMWERGLREAYAQAGVTNFQEYMDLAEQAKIGRLIKSETNPSQRIVQLHPKYATLHTGLFSSSVNETTNNKAESTAMTSSTSNSNINKKKKEDKEKTNTMTKGAADTTSLIDTPTKGNEKSTLFHPHQPSGEKIHVSYFPLCNLLIGQRAEGKMTSGESFVQGILSKHPKIAHFVNSSDQYSNYLARAERDHIIILEGKTGKRLIHLDPRLAKGEEDHQRSRLQQITPNSTAMAHSTSNGSSQQSGSPKAKLDIKEFSRGDTSGSDGGAGDLIERSASPSFATETATAQDRVKFKPLIDTLVSLRKESPLTNLQPPLSRVSGTLVLHYPIDGTTHSPGAWIQKQGFSSFTEYYQEAQRKGFVHLIRGSSIKIIGAKESIRLAEKYERMFFHDAPSA